MSTKQYCWCGISNHSGTQIVGWFSIIMSILSIIMSAAAIIFAPAVNAAAADKHTQGINVGAQVVSIAISVFTIGIVYLMLHGLRIKRPSYYIPYLVLTGLQLIAIVIGAIALVILTILVCVGVFSQIQPEYKIAAIVGALIVDVIFFLFSAIYVFLFFVVPNRSRKQLVEEGRF
ncbi:hypothetical protein M3Y97_01136200 [Aphelenchoides bicaudatus]|nr:hypothetical protein M3Y97_01136200 [Aphelenchoides bicaudatus]